ncbi:MAG: hypothetical protein K2Q26_09540 [Bdellovibrionales bacterium]|nr:hypothetical protein [Bdellovibrionales bacterium]
MRTLHIASIAVLVFTLLGCQLVNKRSSPQSPSTSGVGPKPSVTTAPPAPVQLPEFVGQRAPRVGLILGPGGAKALAHVGVLQELERNKIPVVAIAGLEWGSLIANLYATNAQSHEVDWKISQITKPNIGAKKLFSKKWDPVADQEYDAYLQKIFLQSKLDSNKIPFACPFINGRKVGLAKKGSAVTIVKSCMQFPPIFELKDNMAAPFALGEVTEFLRGEGAELIILVNVLPRVEKSDFAAWAMEDWSWFAWLATQESLNQAKFFGVHEVIKVDTTSFSMVEVDQRLRLIQVGKQGSSDAIDRIVKKYDF